VTEQTQYLTKSGASAYCSLSPRTLDAAKATGALPFFRVGSRKVLFARRDLDRWLSAMRVDVSEKQTEARQ
jgi:excisionase family DNA binding protein